MGGTNRSRPAPEAQSHLGDGRKGGGGSKTVHSDTEVQSAETLQREEVFSSAKCRRESRTRRRENHVFWIL